MHTLPIQDASDLSSLAGKYLVIGLEDETHGLPVPLVREIIRAQKITPLPERSAAIEGVINLRGRVIPIADLRIRLGFPSAFSETTCFVVVNLPTGDGRALPLGFIVDRVIEVAHVPATDIEPAPDLSRVPGSAPLLGIAKSNGRVMPLLDVRTLFQADVPQGV